MIVVKGRVSTQRVYPEMTGTRLLGFYGVTGKVSLPLLQQRFYGFHLSSRSLSLGDLAGLVRCVPTRFHPCFVYRSRFFANSIWIPVRDTQLGDGSGIPTPSPVLSLPGLPTSEWRGESVPGGVEEVVEDRGSGVVSVP